MLKLLERCFPDRWAGWQPAVQQMVPTYGTALGDDPQLADRTLERTAKVLGLHH